MSVELVQILIEQDGQLGQMVIPQDRKELALHLLCSLFDDGVLEARKLPDNFKKVLLSDLEKNNE